MFTKVNECTRELYKVTGLLKLANENLNGGISGDEDGLKMMDAVNEILAIAIPRLEKVNQTLDDLEPELVKIKKEPQAVGEQIRGS